MFRHAARGGAVALVVGFSFLSLSPLSLAQSSRYEGQYGTASDVSLDDLLQMPEAYLGKAVSTKGQLRLVATRTQGVRHALRGTFGGSLYLEATSEAAWDWDQNAPLWIGQEVEVTGLVSMGTDPDAGGRAVFIRIWSFLGPLDERSTDRREALEVTLEDLVTKPGKLDGKKVRVRGQFRGSNLFGDLPSASRRKSADWVIKEELFAAWVSGRKPRGSGWQLDPGLRRDSGKWLEVTGRVATRNGVVTIEADLVRLATPPSPAAQALPAPRPPPPPKKPPVVVFSLPLDGERDVAPNTVFKLQFSSDMDESSFEGRVVLRYPGRPRPGDRELDAVRITYDGGRRALEIDPGDLLRPGRIVEIVLLSGIVDIDGLPLETRPGVEPGASVDVLRFQTAASGALGSLSR